MTRGQSISISILEHLISRRFSEGWSVQLARLDARHAGGWVTERRFHEVVRPHADGIEEVLLCCGEAGGCFNRFTRDLSRRSVPLTERRNEQGRGRGSGEDGEREGGGRKGRRGRCRGRRGKDMRCEEEVK